MLKIDKDYCPAIGYRKHDLRKQLLRRFATNLAVMIAEENFHGMVQRPSEMGCCFQLCTVEVTNRVWETEEWAISLCTKGEGFPADHCDRFHHRWEIALAKSNS